jgi:N-acetylneuraminic acid mutarotase
MCWERPAASVALGSVCPPPMRNHSACPLGAGRMLLFGGFDGATEFSDMSLLTFIDQGFSCEWSQPERQLGAVPGSFSHHTCCITQDEKQMIVFGGYRSGVGHLNETWLLDLQLMAWTSPDYVVGVPPSPRRSHAAAIIEKCMFVFGGYNGKEHLADLHILDLESMAWQLCVQVCGDLPSPRRQHAMAAVGKHLVIHGGYDGQKYLDDIYSFNTDSRIWKRWPIIAPCKEEGASVDNSQLYGRSMQTMVVARQQLVIFGGVCDQGALQDVLFLENAAGKKFFMWRMYTSFKWRFWTCFSRAC